MGSFQHTEKIFSQHDNNVSFLAGSTTATHTKRRSLNTPNCSLHSGTNTSVPSAIPINKNTTSSLENNYPFSVSFKKFHVTKVKKSGYNKIYEFRRSKSFFFEVADQIPNTNEIHLRIHTNDYHMSTTPIQYNSTSRVPNHRFQISKSLQHFFSAQKVLPRRTQSKYFNLIRKKLLDRIDIIRSREQKVDEHNHSTKTFFNFSYKRYRFHFGIYLPCNFDTTHEFNDNVHTTCTIPCPIVMSTARSACGVHWHKKYQTTAIYFSQKPSDVPTNFTNSKIGHANLLYQRWTDGQRKAIFSKRQGISFSSIYRARSVNHLLTKKRSKHMYFRYNWDLQHILSPNPRTAKRQRQRFDRNCRRIFNSIKCGKDRNLPLAAKLSYCKPRGFLFQEGQWTTRPISHIQYRHAGKVPLVKDYAFTIPHRIVNHGQVNINTLLLPTLPVHTAEPYNPIPDMFVPMKYRDIIPSDPIYTNDGTFIVPGSREWFTYMYRLELSTREARKNDRIRIRRDQLRLLQQNAAINGTSVKHYHQRQEEVVDLTKRNDRFHDTITECLQCYAQTPADSKIYPMRHHLIEKFTIFTNNYSSSYYIRPRYTRLGINDPIILVDGYTSDETETLEARPCKRKASATSNLPSHSDQIITKKPCTDLITNKDSITLGSSNFTALYTR